MTQGFKHCLFAFQQISINSNHLDTSQFLPFKIQQVYRGTTLIPIYKLNSYLPQLFSNLSLTNTRSHILSKALLRTIKFLIRLFQFTKYMLHVSCFNETIIDSTFNQNSTLYQNSFYLLNYFSIILQFIPHKYLLPHVKQSIIKNHKVSDSLLKKLLRTIKFFTQPTCFF